MLLKLAAAHGVNMTTESATEKLNAVAVKLLKFVLLDEWNLSLRQAATLLNVDLTTCENLLNGESTKPILDEEQLQLVSGLVKIYKALRAIFPEQDHANAWIHKPNQMYSELSALEFMMQSPNENITVVMNYTQAQLL